MKILGFDFDTTKVKRSAIITLGGMIITIVPVMTSELTDLIMRHDPIDYRTSLILAIGALSTWCVNTAREIIKQLDPKTGLEATD